jgi:MYXO-CTERM domain-containing protein
MTRFRLLFACFALIGVFACGGKGCSCLTPIKGGFPTMERHQGAIQVRATAGLFDYLQKNGAAIIPKLLPGGNTINVPPSCSGNKVCCSQPNMMCQLQLTPQALVLQPTAPNVLHLDLTTQLKTVMKLPIEYNTGLIGTAKCLVTIDTTMSTSGMTAIDVVSDISFPVNKTTNETEIQLANTAINNLDQSMLTLESQPGDFLCTVANFGPIKSFLISQITGQLSGQISSTVQDNVCMKCMDKSDCDSFASDCQSGKCVEADGKTCIQQVGIAGRMDIGSALAKLSPSTTAFMDTMAVLGGYSHADTGLSLGMLGGGLSDPPSQCVPRTMKPAAVMPAESKTFTTDVLPDESTPYHVGIGVHVSHLDQIGWAAFDGGALCLAIGTPQVALLSSSTIGVVIPSLSDLVHVGDAPMFLVFRPQAPPTFKLGKGTFKVDAMGKKTIDDALLHISVPNFLMDFYAFVDDRYVRVMTLGSDLELPVGLDVDGMGQIVPLLGDFTAAFTNVKITNSELLAETPHDLAKTFPMLLGVAAGQLGSVLKPIALPAVMGLNLHPVAITSTDPGADGVNQFLSIFADISVATAESITVDTEAQMAAIELPPRNEFAVTDEHQAPKLTLALAGHMLGPNRPFEYSVNLDDSGWSPFSETSQLEVENALLWLPGKHQLQVRGRVVGEPNTLDPTPAVVDFEVAPTNDFHGRTTNPPSAGCGSCRIGGGDESSGAGALLVLLALVAVWKRRRLALVLALLAGCNDSLGKADFENPVDEIGRYSDLAASKGVVHVSAYDDSVGDLAYAKITDPTQPISWQYVDGLDPSAQSDLSDSYRHNVSDAGPDVGLYSSIALTSGGDPRIAYYDNTNQALKFASGSKRFDSHTVDAGMGNVKVGLFTRIVLDSSDVPAIAYMATGISDGKGGFRSELRVAVARSSSPSSGADWSITVADTTRVSCAGLCPSNQACVVAAMVNGMPNGDPAQSTCTPVDANPCAAMCATTEACIGGKCTAFLGKVKAADLPEGIGLFTQALKVNGALTLIYYDRAQGDLKMATRKADGSFAVTLLDGNNPSTDVGQFCTAQVASDGTILVAYVDAIEDRLLYTTVTGGMPEKSPELIDDGIRDDGKHPVGAGAAMVLVGNSPRVVYQDQAVSDLLSATRGSMWTHQPLDTGVAGFGWWPRLAQDGGNIWLGQFVYDRENGAPPVGTFQLSTLK